MADILFDNSFLGSRYFSKRFTCQCYDPAHSFDITVGQEFKGCVTWDFTFAGRYISKKWNVLVRIKRAIQVLRGKEVFDHEFCMREDDIEELEEMAFVAKTWRKKDTQQRLDSQRLGLLDDTAKNSE